MDAFSLARVVLGAGFLAVAAVSDVRTRRVADPTWVAMGSIGLVLLAAEIVFEGWFWTDWLLLVSAAILFYAVFYGKPVLDEEGVRLRPVRIALLAAAAVLFLAVFVFPRPVYAAQAGVVSLSDEGLAAMPVLVLVYQGFYYVGLLRGGADTKGLIALSLLLPFYPDVAPFPLLPASSAATNALRLLFPFSFTVFVDAAVLMLVVPLGYVIVNAARGDVGSPMWRGVRAPIDRIPPHSWVMERVDDRGERYVVLFPSHKVNEADILAKLRAAGATRVWIERKIPFLVLVFAGFLVAFVLGNLIVGLLTAAFPAP